MSLITNLISHWKLDEASGTRNDSHGTNHLTDNNAVGSGTGIIGNAGDFNPLSLQFLNRTTNSTLETGDIDFTYACWAKTDDFSTHRPILQKGWDASYGEGLLSFDSGVGKISFQIANGNGSAKVSWSSTANAGQWYFIVAGYNSITDEVFISIDGGTPVVTSYAGGNASVSGDFKIGLAFGVYFDGLIDSVSFWKRALSTAEITQLYNGGLGLDYSSFGGGAETVSRFHYDPVADALKAYSFVETASISPVAMRVMSDGTVYLQGSKSIDTSLSKTFRLTKNGNLIARAFTSTV